MKKRILAISALIALIFSTGCANNIVEQTQNPTSVNSSASSDNLVQSSTQADMKTVTIQDTNKKYTVEISIPQDYEIPKSLSHLVCIEMNDNTTGVISIMDNLGESVDIGVLNTKSKENKENMYSNGIEELTVNDYTIKYIMYKSGDEFRVESFIFVNDDIVLYITLNNKNDDVQETIQYIENLVQYISNIQAN